ncbi:MAG: Bacterial alpha-L-rhamnosidase [Planctomycetes bacterium ADurb.Bin126]|nr:MAG: Bacterial alpha-L-rhamnosidase [Planctomycetes bacterium ADurb.Bin126]HOD80491.1 family 78 glycoside hydrolase catalytic domain [Phycisphaerae bacterium]HQL72103.1 family 78 glycoside hydrolase catalytic domain [Phycisphaerae bacterium]
MVIRGSLAFMCVAACAIAAEPVPLQVTEVAPTRMEVRGRALFADFGKAAYGNLQVAFAADPPAGELTVRLGEKITEQGVVDRKPPGSVNYREVKLAVRPGQRTYRLAIPSKPFHKGKASVKTPPSIGEVTVFRYVEIEGVAPAKDALSLRQLFVHAPFDDEASSFESSDKTLNAVWDLCKHTMKATTAFGVYIDGERERIPYEADAYINQLSHYACDLDPRVARATVAHLLAHPTWPTEWSLHMPMMAAADYLATGDAALAREHYQALKKKLLMDKARDDGLLRASAIVDWPAAERDGYNDGVVDPKQTKQVGPMINTVVNAFYYHALNRMALLARAVDNEDDARDSERKAAQVRDSFNRVFFDAARGLYVDGEGSRHASLHANMVALAFELAPPERVAKVAAFVRSRGMACSVYGAQYLLEGLFLAGEDRYAVDLMTARTKRSWWHMIESGSTMTWEAWDAQFKKNLTWNHAWGAVPANILARFVLGVRPAAPGYSKITIAPQPGGLAWVRGKVPTAVGPVAVKIENAATFRMEIELPAKARGSVALPMRQQRQVLLDGKPEQAVATDRTLNVEVPAGRHVLESR